MSLIREVYLVDGYGNTIEAHEDADGEHYIGVANIQAVHGDPNNSSTTNLTSSNSYTFTGVATSTLGVVGLQWSLKTDQDATVYIEESPDGTNWDLSYSFGYVASLGGRGETIQATQSYWRIKVILNGTTDTTYFRLSGVLCPIASPLPSALSSDGRLLSESSLVDNETGTNVDVEPLGALRTIIPTRLIGTGFSGTTKDTNFWTETVTGTGSITQAGEITVATGTTANSTAQYDSVRRARKVSGTVNQFRTIARLSTAAEADNLRRIGPYDDDEGFFFQINGTTFGVGVRKGTSDTIVNSGSFNGNYGDTVVMDTNTKRLVIDYSSVSAKFFVNGTLLHTISATTAANTNTLSLPIRMENVNSNGNTTDNSFQVRLATILRLGQLNTLPQYKYIGTNTTTICKYDAGILRKIVNVDNAGTVTVYDNTAASGTQIAVIDTTKALGTLSFDAPFSNGLTIVTATGAKVTVIYE